MRREWSIPYNHLVAQHIYGLALGYEDLNDHDVLRSDSLLVTLVGKTDVTGKKRIREQDKGSPLASSSTLNRLKLSEPDTAQQSRYKRIAAEPESLDRLLVDLFVESYKKPPREIWLDLDATDDPLHGQQEGRYFHGYYRCYCYLPLYIFCGGHLLCARLRPSNQDGAAGSMEELSRIVSQIREHWPKTRIVIRGDSGFCRESIMAWCEANRVKYVLGLARNKRLVRAIGGELHKARIEHGRTSVGGPFVYFSDRIPYGDGLTTHLRLGPTDQKIYNCRSQPVAAVRKVLKLCGIHTIVDFSYPIG